MHPGVSGRVALQGCRLVLLELHARLPGNARGAWFRPHGTGVGQPSPLHPLPLP